MTTNHIKRLAELCARYEGSCQLLYYPQNVPGIVYKVNVEEKKALLLDRSQDRAVDLETANFHDFGIFTRLQG